MDLFKINWLVVFFTYAIVWWILIFTILPFGVERDPNPAPGHSHAAPKQPHLRIKLVVNSVLSLVVTAVLVYAGLHLLPWLRGAS